MSQLNLFGDSKPNDAIVKGISLWQPWAWMIDVELKKYETRSWGTGYRGLLAICSAKKNTNELKYFFESWKNEQSHLLSELQSSSRFLLMPMPWSSLRFGEIICLVELIDCIRMDQEFINQQSPIELSCGDWKVGRFAWKLKLISRILGYPIKGQQGLFDIPFKLSGDK